jgi:Eisosome component PIL1
LTHRAAAVSDRLGFLNYIAASLASTLSAKLNTARLPLKELRDNEVALVQKRSIHTGLEQQISRIENSREKGSEKRLAELKEQLAKVTSDNEPVEKQHDILLRKALKESEQVKFQALREVIEIVWAQLTIVSLLPFPVRRKACARRTGC